MGHIRLGALPRTKAWRTVFEALSTSGVPPEQVASAVARAAQTQFEKLKGDRGVNYCFWMLVRVVTAARGPAFPAELDKLRIDCRGVSSGVGFIQRVAQATGEGIRARGGSAVFARMGELSLCETLTAHVAEEAGSLFGTTLSEIQQACRKLATRNRFGAVGRDFFARFSHRCISYLVDKETSNHVGQGQAFESPSEVLNFQADLKRYCSEASRIVEEYSGGWFSLHNWETNNAITEEGTLGFAAYALEKMQMELAEGQK